MNTDIKLEGIVPVRKPVDWTSHDVVAKARRILKEKRIGHTGTLDPKVTGVLPLCVGRATRMVEYIQDLPKQYEATLTFGYSTDTEDATGTVIEKLDHVTVDETAVRKAIQSFIGEIEQVPPMYSALKVGGKRLYELARQGQEVEREARKVTIYGIELLDFDLDKPHPEVRFRVDCSKGTYIRTLCVDIGRSLGLPAVMSQLVRTRTGGIGLEQCVTLEQLEAHVKSGTLSDVLIAADQAVSYLPVIRLSEEKARHALQGRQVYAGDAELLAELPVDSAEPLVRAYDHMGEFIGIFQLETQTARLKPVKVFS